MTSWEQATGPFNLDSEEYVETFLKQYDVSFKRCTPSAHPNNYLKNSREFKRLLNDEEIYMFSLLRYVINKVRRGMDGIQKGEKLVALADMLIAGLWYAYVHKKVTALEVVKVVQSHLQKWCVVFENFPIHRSYQIAVRREKKRIEMGKGRSSFRVPRTNYNDTPGEVMRRKILQKVEQAGYHLHDEDQVSKLMVASVHERVKHLLSVMNEERIMKNTYYEDKVRVNYLNDIAGSEFHSENTEVEQKQKRALKGESTESVLVKQQKAVRVNRNDLAGSEFQLYKTKEAEQNQKRGVKRTLTESLLVKQQRAALVNRVNNARTARNNSKSGMIPSLDEFLKENKKTTKANNNACQPSSEQGNPKMEIVSPIYVDEIIAYMIEEKEEFGNEFRNKWIERQEYKSFQRSLNETNLNKV